MSRLILVMITGMIGPNVSWFVTGGFHWRITYNYASHWPPSHHCVWVSLWCDCVMSWYWPGWLLLRPLCGLAQSELLLPCGLLLQNSSELLCHNKIIIRRGCQHALQLTSLQQLRPYLFLEARGHEVSQSPHAAAATETPVWSTGGGDNQYWHWHHVRSPSLFSVCITHREPSQMGEKSKISERIVEIDQCFGVSGQTLATRG